MAGKASSASAAPAPARSRAPAPAVRCINGIYGHQGPQGQQWLDPLSGIWYQRKNDLFNVLRKLRDDDPSSRGAEAMKLMRKVEKSQLEKHGTIAFCLKKSTIQMWPGLSKILLHPNPPMEAVGAPYQHQKQQPAVGALSGGLGRSASTSSASSRSRKSGESIGGGNQVGKLSRGLGREELEVRKRDLLTLFSLEADELASRVSCPVVRIYGSVDHQINYKPNDTGGPGEPKYGLPPGHPIAPEVSSGLHGDRAALLTKYLADEVSRQEKEGMPLFPAGQWRTEGRNPFSMQEDWALLVATAEGMNQQLEAVDDLTWGLETVVPPAPLVYVELRGMSISPLLKARMANSGASHCVRDRLKKIRSHLRKNSLDLDTCNPERTMAILYGKAWNQYANMLRQIGHLPRVWPRPHDSLAQKRALFAVERDAERAAQRSGQSGGAGGGQKSGAAGAAQKRSSSSSSASSRQAASAEEQQLAIDRELVRKGRTHNMLKSTAPWAPPDDVSLAARMEAKYKVHD